MKETIRTKFLDIFDPLPLMDRHSFLAYPLENHVEFWRTNPSSLHSDRIFFRFFINFQRNFMSYVFTYLLQKFII